MSIFPKKYHGPELKCSGPGFCPDCTEQANNKKRNPILIMPALEIDWKEQLKSHQIEVKDITENSYSVEQCCFCGQAHTLVIDSKEKKYSCSHCGASGEDSQAIYTYLSKSYRDWKEFWDFILKK